MSEQNATVDIVIFGGGIAGLWALHRLRQLGYQAILLESHTLGGGQTIKSQGIIHGGLKYALGGFLTDSANAVEAMPNRWKTCLQGNGEIDLRPVNILADHQLLWSSGSLSSNIASFFASKALNSRAQKLKPAQYPLLLQNADFRGQAYRLEELVLDTASLIRTLAATYQNCIFKIHSEQGYEFVHQAANPQNILSVNLNSGATTLNLQAKRYLFTAGEGNALLCQSLSNAPAMQCRPLQMIMVKLPKPYLFFAHCIDYGMNPRITITTHPTQNGHTVWYLGGQIAEDGVNRTSSEQIQVAQQELRQLFPWVDFSDAQWSSFFINRAELKQPGGKRPESAFIETVGNCMVAWPTKLALAPLLSDHIIASLQQQNITPSIPTEVNDTLLSHLEKPKVAQTPWDAIW